MRDISTSPILALFAVTSVMAGSPRQDEVFTIASWTPAKTNYVSADYIFSALESYEEVPDPGTINDYPSQKKAAMQQGAIVLRNKTALFFQTLSPKYLSVLDPSNHMTLYRLTKAPLHRSQCPKLHSDIDALPFP